DPRAAFRAEDNIIAGNVIGYGATAGELFVRGVVGERFCVRNSGALAVVEGTGDHACEYMTGGSVVILGPTGRNLAAGMSGGVAYVLDLEPRRVNGEMVELEPLAEPDAAFLLETVRRHHQETGSVVAERLLRSWDRSLARFTKVMPTDYKRVLAAQAQAAADGTDLDEAVMAAAHG
ncbi:MAG TPA: glutamate synthase subunit alpha, partial [Mycobacteriales bacterium]|nr:glutamate synthase subunit alpha [Mycobacteriales bacterium]